MLTDNEIRDILKYLQSGKPLPDKYRFLLLRIKREVELVWNGKTNEVCNIVMPFQTIEQVDEPRNDSDAKIQKSLFDFGELTKEADSLKVGQISLSGEITNSFFQP